MISIINTRLKKFRDQLVKNGMDGALVYNNANRNYLTGFTGEESYIIVTKNNAVFITDSRYTVQAKSEVKEFEVRQYNINIGDFIKDMICSMNIKRLGFEENYMTFEMYKELCSDIEDVEFVGLDGMIEKLRQVKDTEEIKNIEGAALIADEGFSHILNFIRHGVSENSINLELEFFMRSKGASSLSFPSIVASGKRSALPHGKATNKIVELGDFLTLDFGCVYNGYCSDMTRTVVLGRATDRQKDIYSTVLKANEEALEHIKPGISGEELDRIARKVIEDRGFGDNFGHGLGHGVGMEVHELPFISKKGKEPIEDGMIITDEPGIYIPDFGGVRIEDLVLVTQKGCRVISKAHKHLIEIF